MILTNKKPVESLEAGARKFGGATKGSNGNIYSFTDTASIIPIQEINELILYIPAEVDGAEKWAINQLLHNKDFIHVQTPEQVNGSWYSEEKDSVIIEGITLIKFYTKHDSMYSVYGLAEGLKRIANQEAVAFEVNNNYMVIV